MMGVNKGDGKFRWYVAHAEDAEAFDASSSTRGEALKKGLAKYGDRPFCLIEADMMVPDHAIFDADRIFEDFADHNAMCWGEDGMEWELEPEDRVSMEAHLAEAFRFWMWKNDCIPPVWCVAEARTVEQINSTGNGEQEGNTQDEKTASEGNRTSA